jgi:hypothetical protein
MSRIPLCLRALTVAALLLAAGCGAAQAACGDGARFAVKGETAVDRATGLIWRRCALGTEWTSGRCVGERRLLPQDSAVKAGKEAGAGWRLPTVEELYRLVDPACGLPPVDRALFPDVQADPAEGDPTWTSSPTGMGGLWYYVDLATGEADGHSRGFSLGVRLVRDPVGR